MVENSINKENTPTKTEEFFTPSENYYVTPNDNEGIKQVGIKDKVLSFLEG